MPRPEVRGLALPELAGLLTADDIAATASAIEQAQRRDGAIPWYDGGHIDLVHNATELAPVIEGFLAERPC